jgi:hypothetical protein
MKALPRTFAVALALLILVPACATRRRRPVPPPAPEPPVTRREPTPAAPAPAPAEAPLLHLDPRIGHAGSIPLAAPAPEGGPHCMIPVPTRTLESRVSPPDTPVSTTSYASVIALMVALLVFVCGWVITRLANRR